jgi:signal transduction histidine kinase
MYLHTRLLLGILGVTLFALLVSVLVPLGSLRQDVSRETDASMQLASLLLDIEASIRGSEDAGEARAAAARELRRAEHLRHVSLALLDEQGAAIATTPNDTPAGGWLARLFLPYGTERTLAYPLSYRGAALGALRVRSNPLSEFEELEDRVSSDIALLAVAIVAMAISIYWMVRRGLRPVGEINGALTRLADGNLETRLPHFRLKDLDEICDRFNHCAAALQESAATRRELMRRVIDVEEEERTRLARELHDELGQSLTAIKVDAAYIAREAAGKAPMIQSCAQGIERLCREVMELTRGMLARLRPHGLETVGLRASLQELVSGWQARVAERFSCTLDVNGPVELLGADLNITLYRLVQECLTNAVRHSSASAVALEVLVDPGPSAAPPRVWLRVRESGVTDAAGVMSPHGMGLLGMRERVEARGGQLSVRLQPGTGLLLEAWMPIEARRQERVDG